MRARSCSRMGLDMKSSMPTAKQRSLSRIPLGRLGEVEDLMGMALYLLSPASDFCTGQVMYVDGGFTAG